MAGSAPSTICRPIPKACAKCSSPEGCRLWRSTDDYYRATYPVVAQQDAKAFRPLSRRRSARRAILQHLHEREVTLPTGGKLTSAVSSSWDSCWDSKGMDAPLHARIGVLRRRERRGVEPAVPARLRKPPAIRNESDLRRAARDVLHAAGRVALVRASRARRVSRNALDAGKAAGVHRRNDLPVDVRRLSGARTAARGRDLLAQDADLADALRSAKPRGQPGARGGCDLRRGHVRAARVTPSPARPFAA